MQRENWPESELITDELIRLKYEAIINPKNKKSLLKGMRSFITFFGFKKHTYQPIIDGLSSIEKPLLTFWGREDDTLPVAWTQKIAEACPQAQIEIFDACGHDPMVEKSVAFNQIVLDFLSDSQGKRMTLNQI
jgi:pimeloyl-ACP methyl ester carboxylesterase